MCITDNYALPVCGVFTLNIIGKVKKYDKS